MNFKFLDRNHRASILLVEKTKDETGKFKDKTISNFGTYTDSLTLGSTPVIELFRNIIKTVSTVVEESFFKTRMNDKDFVKFLNSQVDFSETTVLNLSPLLLDRTLESFGLKELFKDYQAKTYRGYDLYEYFEFIVFNNITDPGSLLSYFHHQDEYEFYPFGTIIKKQDLYDFLTFFYEHHLEIQRKLFETSIKIIRPKEVQVYFYDGTNFTYTVSKVDPDFLDPLDQTVKKGLRQFGYSKNKRFDRVTVGMGIIATAEEIPLFTTIFSGNEQEISNIKTDIDKLTTALLDLDINDTHSIIAADAANYSGDLIFRLAGPNNTLNKGEGYIIGRSINSVDQETRDWCLDPTGYYPISRRKKHYNKKQRKEESCTMVKSRVVRVNINVKLENGKIEITQSRQKQVALLSGKRRYKALETLERNLEKIDEVVKNPSKLKKLFNKQYFKFTEIVGLVDQDSGELTNDLKALFDIDKIQEEIQKSGYFIITTSEIDWPDGKVLHFYREKNKIEHLIRTLKSVIKASPAFVYTYDHIVSHFDLSTISLALLNYIRESTKRITNICLSAERIQNALQRFQVPVLRDGVFMITSLSEDLKLILQTFSIDLKSQFYSGKDLIRIFGH